MNVLFKADPSCLGAHKGSCAAVASGGKTVNDNSFLNQVRQSNTIYVILCHLMCVEKL